MQDVISSALCDVYRTNTVHEQWLALEIRSRIENI